MRTTPIIEDTFYHVFNRGSNKRTLFYDKKDYARFLYLLLYLQSPLTFPQTNRFIAKFVKTGTFNVTEEKLTEMVRGRFVELQNFCIMPNHFHLTVRNVTKDGLSKYMHKVGNAYAQYFNTKYETTGHVFQGAYKARLIETDEYLQYLSAYIHKNPNELKKWSGIESEYPWSSFQDYRSNRWDTALNVEYLMRGHSSFAAYEEYVNNSGAKWN